MLVAGRSGKESVHEEECQLEEQSWERKCARGKRQLVRSTAPCMQEGGDSWKEAKHACREGRPKDSRVRVFVRFCVNV
jgi:hypothetical protein